MDNNTADLVERLTRLLVAEGTPRAAALIFSLLMYTPGAWSIDELAQELKLSKASVSLNTRFLEQAALIERVFVPGERKVHFRLTTKAVDKWLERETQMLAAFLELLQDGAARLGPGRPEVKARLEEFAGFYGFLLEHLPELADHWYQEKAARAARTDK
ncbi:MAG: GbsR/MarR family transcriptional regulator [Chitinophagales bacterium]